MTLPLALDLVLLVLFAVRLVRLVVVDDVGEWVFRGPAERWADRHATWELAISGGVRGQVRVDSWRDKVVDGLGCPFCVGFWLCALAVASLVVATEVGGTLLLVWRLVAGVFALSYVVGHAVARLD